jgi:glycosyltransferase involved in cell wall biosynthesis
MAEPSISVMIPTFNEAHHIDEVVANARSLGPVFVLDSCSTDGTQRRAREAGATVVEHPFEGYARQKNWGLQHLPLDSEWVFILDADERLTQGLIRELRTKLADPAACDGWYVNRLTILFGRPIRHGGLYPAWNLRCFRKGQAFYEDRLVHEHMICQGETDFLENHLLHVRRETASEYIDKHIDYALLESEEWLRYRLNRQNATPARHLFKRELRFRQWMKRRVWPRTPLRPLWRFLYMYLLKQGFRDGRLGWHLAMLMVSYEYMIGLCYHEKLAAQRQEHASFQPGAAEQGPSKLSVPDQKAQQ